MSGPTSTVEQHQTAHDLVHIPIPRILPFMDRSDSVSTTSSSPDSTVSGVAVSLSSIALSHPDEEPKTITDLPSEMILRIYELLDSPSDITALNSTSQTSYWIWRTNVSSISWAVLSRSMTGYDRALELFEVEERVKQIHCIILPQFAILKRLRVAQRQARDAVQQGRRNDKWDHVSKDAFYRAVLHRNDQLLSAARKASYLLGLIEKKVVCSGGVSTSSQVAPSSQDIIVAYYELIILIRLRSLKAMKDRLKTMCEAKIRKMLYVATYIVCDCPDKDKIRLGISRRITLRVVPWSRIVDNWDPDHRPRCQMIVAARRAFFAVADAVGEPRIADHLVENRSGCQGHCEEIGRVGTK